MMLTLLNAGAYCRPNRWALAAAGAASDRSARRPSAQLTLKRICIWCGIGFLVVLFVMFMLAADLIPPLSPTSDAQHLTWQLVDHKLRIRWGVASRCGRAIGAVPMG
jgi:hypothetical protein